jgi:hypothetical protein
MSQNCVSCDSGLQPSAGCWLKWNIHLLELQDKPADNDVAELSLIVSGRSEYIDFRNRLATYQLGMTLAVYVVCRNSVF